MRLIVDQKNTAVQGGTVPVRWCLYRKELEELERRGVNKPHVLIVVRNNNHEHRQLVPMDQMMAYVQFHRFGENTIHAAVVWHNEDNVKKLKSFFLEKYSRLSYEHGVLRLDEKLGFKEYYSSNGQSYNRLDETAHVTVMVPEEFFSKEPSRFEKWWVNLFFEYRPVDQCQFRRRRMLAYSVQPFAVLAWVIVITIARFIGALVLSIAGMRGTDWNPVIHPFRYPTGDIKKRVEKGDSVFWCKKDGEKYPLMFRAFSPPVLLVLSVLLVGLGVLGEWTFSYTLVPWWYYAVVGVVLPFVIAAVAAVAYAAFTLVWILLTALIFKPIINWIANNSDAWEQKRMERKRAAKERKEREQKAAEERLLKERAAMHEELEQLLACNGELQPSINALPQTKRTIHLRFLDLKAQICRPYAQ
ncbi:MAG TPA: hypothetical protein ENH86_02170 [Candidatus Jorgensenbacteria bacterium]|uniref:Uncharacterized protein n=1 Tax=marine sediment metagenome TaxID=412755 RepID=A0A0F9P4P2_9ZZZZ|nr:hypothetical protein [Candidatus Jorgensenbacteria bacterium]